MIKYYCNINNSNNNNNNNSNNNNYCNNNNISINANHNKNNNSNNDNNNNYYNNNNISINVNNNKNNNINNRLPYLYNVVRLLDGWKSVTKGEVGGHRFQQIYHVNVVILMVCFNPQVIYFFIWLISNI